MSPESTLALDRPQLLTEQDLYLFNEGSNHRTQQKMGAHLYTHNGTAGAIFSVWAPNARTVSVVGSFNSWDPKANVLQTRGSSGIWEGFVPNSGGASRLQNIRLGVPGIETANHRDRPRIRSPHAEDRARRPVVSVEMGTHLLLRAVVAAFVEQVEILLGQKLRAVEGEG